MLLRNLRSWKKEFLNLSHISFPNDINHRMIKNLTYYLPNYFVSFALIFTLSAISHLTLFLSIVISFIAWGVLTKLKISNLTDREIGYIFVTILLSLNYKSVMIAFGHGTFFCMLHSFLMRESETQYISEKIDNADESEDENRSGVSLSLPSIVETEEEEDNCELEEGTI